MSYILEALRKAESERERGLVPGLNAQPLGPADGERALGTARLRTWAPWAIAAVAVLVAGVSAWTWRNDVADQRQAAAQPVSQPEVVPPSVPAAPVFAPAAAVPLPPAALPPATAAAPPPAAVTRLATNARMPAAPGALASAAVQSTSAPGNAAPVAVPEQRVVTLAELPDATRRELPALSVAGASYSEHPANRLLIVNGNVFHEGDRLAPDLLLEHIDLKAAVLQFKGVRFSMTY